MKLIIIAFSLCIIFPLLAKAQEKEEDNYRICTEIVLNPGEVTDTPDLPPGLTAKAVAFKPELGKYWPNGRVLKVGFIGGDEAMRNRVIKYAREWSTVANIRFQFVEKGETDLRVAFTQGMGTWSLIGTDASQMPQYKPTINFGWFNKRMPEAEYRATILHEFGHALGLLHEHQHPLGGIPWDKPKLYNFYLRTQGWDQSMVDQQVLKHYNTNKTQYSQYDPYSIMHYPIPNSLTMGDFEVGMNMDLSATDKAFINKVYPRKNGIPAATPPAEKPMVRSKPTTPTRTKPVATSSGLSITFRDMLPETQTREQVWITLDGVTRTFVLDQEGSQAGKITFNFPGEGRYSYVVRTKTTFLERVNGRLQERTLNGYSEGEMLVRKNAVYDLAIGKNYNDRWFEVKLLPASGSKVR
ncbi:MAG: hypothetical protein JNM22_07885 [Saprospiraceae bacterium]|nr:hypothetical protein [Saprospiraceae bacterium]